jgi:small subunit ribosomal protein S3
MRSSFGRGGSGLEDLKKSVEKFLEKLGKRKGPYDREVKATKQKVELAVEPVKEPNLSAFLVATNIADQVARRMPHKRVCNQALERVMGAGAKGVKIKLSGRINGAEIARIEKFASGSVPLSTIREEVDFAAVPSLTKSGYIGVKVWICRK